MVLVENRVGHVLLVEDDERLAEAVTRGLQEKAFAVDRVGDGLAALDALDRGGYDVVVLDLMLPKLGGEEVLKAIRARGLATPILVLTAKDQLRDKVAMLNAGADDYLTKPYAFEELVARIQVLLRRGQVPETELVHGSLRLDLLTRQAFRDNQALDLRPREFALLEFFVRRAEQVLSRHMISEHVWGSDYAAYSNVIDVHIRNIRKKLGRPDVIHSVRGSGYMLQERG